MPLCKYCGEDKAESAFQVAAHVKGKTYKRLKCTTCKTKDQTSRRKAIREVLAKFKAENCCSHCGFSNPHALQFHHVGEKEDDISNAVMRGWSLDRLMEEVKQCIILCGNCHLILHAKERQGVAS